MGRRVLIVKKLGLALSVGTLAVWFLASGLSTAAQTPPPKPQHPDRTRPMLGKMTSHQRERAKHHSREVRSAERIVDRKESVWLHYDPRFPVTKTTDGLLTEWACKADAVFIGQIESITSHPTEDGTFIFSDYTVRPVELFRTSKGVDVRAGHTLIISRPGGELLVEDALIKAIIDSHPPLRLKSRYLFFVSHIPGAAAFAQLTPSSVFEASGAALVPVKELPVLPSPAWMLTASFVRQLLGALPC